MLAMTSKFGKWLEGMLAERGMTQAELARKARKKTGQITELFNEKRNPGTKSLNAVADALEIPRLNIYIAAGHIPPITDVDSWIGEMNVLLADITDDKDREIIEGMIRVVREKNRRNGRRKGNEGSS